MLNALISLFNRDEEGQGLAEYALILALIAIVAIVALIFLGGQVSADPVDRRQLGLVRAHRSVTHATPAADAAVGVLISGGPTHHRGDLSAGCIQTAGLYRRSQIRGRWPDLPSRRSSRWALARREVITTVHSRISDGGPVR